MKTLESERLILREFELSDLEDFFEYCSMETVGPKAGWSVHENREHSLKILQGFLEKKDVWAIVNKDNNKVIGSVGLHSKFDGEKEFYEIGYVLSTLYEGKGLMTETVQRVIKYAFDELSVPEIFVCHFLENDKSRRVIEKCKFQYLEVIQYETVNFGKKLSKLYHLTKEQYKNTREEK